MKTKGIVNGIFITGLAISFILSFCYFRICSRGGIEWRGTVYSLEELKKQTL